MNELKELKERCSKINALLDKLDERLVQGELSEAKYKELTEKYKGEADCLKNEIAEKELLQDVGLKAEDKEEPVAEYPEPEKPVFKVGAKYCSNCGAVIDERAEICPRCGVRVSEPPRIPIIPEKKNVALTVVLSFLIPGLGQIYCGKVARGAGILVLSILVISMFSFAVISNPNSQDAAFPFLLWILVYIWNLYDAYKLAGKINRGEAY
ncbi:MAG: zinc ribbon domain-containing protein [Candidatus Methanoperedens sp.]